MGHEFASCCLNQSASTDPWSKDVTTTYWRYLDLGSGVKLLELTDYTTGRDPGLDGPVGLQTERPTCRAWQLV